MSVEALFYVCLGIISIFYGMCLVSCRNTRRRVEEFFESSTIKDIVTNQGAEILLSFENRMKRIEVEWEDVYDKLDRLMKRRTGALGGRPRLPDTIPSSEMGATEPETPASRRAAIAARIRVSRGGK